MTKAWFISPAHRWTVTSTSAQSRLLLSDKLVLFAVIVLNDGSGNIMRRRLLSFASQGQGKPLQQIASTDLFAQPSSSASEKQGKPSSLSSSYPSSEPLSSAIVKDIAQRSFNFLGSSNRRRGRSLLQSSSSSTGNEISTISDQQIQRLLLQIKDSPRTGTMPPINYDANVSAAIANIYGVEDKYYALLNVGAVGKFSVQEGITQEQVNDEMTRRVIANKAIACSNCVEIYPAFGNMREVDYAEASTRRSARNLLQQQQDDMKEFKGTISILLVYDKVTSFLLCILLLCKIACSPTCIHVPSQAPLNGSKYSISFADISKAVYMPTFTNVWSGSSDPASLQAFIDAMKASQFVVTTIKADDGSSSSILVDMVQSGVIIPSPSPNPPTPSTTPPGLLPKHYAMDMTVFGISDLRSIPSTGEYHSSAASSSKNGAFDPMVAFIFLAASLLVFWG